MWFEDMKSDFDGEIDKLQKFLGTTVSGETMEELKKRVNIEKMTATAVKEMGGAGEPPPPKKKTTFERSTSRRFISSFYDKFISSKIVL